MHQAILFDCDGVLVDSEPLTMRVLRDLLAERGWDMSLKECMQRFVGKATRDEAALIEARTGQPASGGCSDARRGAGHQCDAFHDAPSPNAGLPQGGVAGQVASGPASR